MDLEFHVSGTLIPNFQTLAIFWIPRAEYRIPKQRIPDSHAKIHGFRNPDYLKPSDYWTTVGYNEAHCEHIKKEQRYYP